MRKISLGSASNQGTVVESGWKQNLRCWKMRFLYREKILNFWFIWKWEMIRGGGSQRDVHVTRESFKRLKLHEAIVIPTSRFSSKGFSYHYYVSFFPVVYVIWLRNVNNLIWREQNACNLLNDFSSPSNLPRNNILCVSQLKGNWVFASLPSLASAFPCCARTFSQRLRRRNE